MKKRNGPATPALENSPKQTRQRTVKGSKGIGVASGLASGFGSNDGICGFGSANDQEDGSSGSPEMGGCTDSGRLRLKFCQREDAATEGMRLPALLEGPLRLFAPPKSMPLRDRSPGNLLSLLPATEAVLGPVRRLNVMERVSSDESCVRS